MELELQREHVNGYDLVLSTALSQEETQESIVPDACPDILRILDTRAQAFLTGKQVRDGLVTVSGLVRANVFYLPENQEGPVCRMEIAVPFTCQAEAPDLTAQGKLVAQVRVRCAEARVLNPRKVLLRADLLVDLDAYQSNDMELCCGAEGNEPYGVQQLTAQEHTPVTSAVKEKAFTYADRIDLGIVGGNEAKVLSVCGEAFCSESKLVGNKLIFKGFVNAELLLCDNGELRTVNQPMAFSQIMEVSHEGESCSCAIRVAITDMRFDPGESFLDNELTVELLAQAVVRERKAVNVLQDLYSTGWNTDVTTHAYPMYCTLEDGERIVPVREQLESTTLVRGIVHHWSELGAVHVKSEGGQTVLTAEVGMTVMYLDDGDELQSVHKTLSLSSRLDCAGTLCRCWCASPKEVFVTPASGGMEVRFALEFHYLVMLEKQVSAILAASVAGERTSGEGAQPSVVLRMAAPGERLWDIAKLYGTTAEEIVQANELQEDDLPHGKMLLIPRVR